MPKDRSYAHFWIAKDSRITTRIITKPLLCLGDKDRSLASLTYAIFHISKKHQDVSPFIPLKTHLSHKCTDCLKEHQ